jgi:hypothetical protein
MGMTRVVGSQVLTYAWGSLVGVFAFAVYYLFVQVRIHTGWQASLCVR